ncbi:MAG: chemotaxis protein MotA [Fusobacteriaceae bacterium]|jgi:chemotaxis protein MotA|nr:MotA/TolQ/ExbB proton channel [Fusobacteriales bacterium]MDN5303742.1 chemotaxis protein MotA [Fusobacteriaceae bacterium]
MDISTILGFVLIFALMAMGMGFNFGPFIDPPSFFIVVGGTFGALFMSFPLNIVLGLPKIGMKAIKNEVPDSAGLISTLVSFSEKARKEGLLAIEADIETIEDDFLKKGIQLVVDGTDPELVKNILDTEVGFTGERHELGKSMFKTIASLGPAYGMIGTLIGLILMLGSLDDPSSIGPKMAIALITTLYGSILANALGDPIANKLEFYNTKEIAFRELAIEGILSLQAGDNPKVLEEKLKSFLSPDERASLSKEEGE